MLLQVLMKVRFELACCAINIDGLDGCRGAIASWDYTATEIGIRFNGATIQIV
jgi:hypothetical protein